MTEERHFKRSPLLANLAKRYPYQFLEPPLEMSQDVPVGWLPLFEALCADVDRLLNGNPQGFHWSQLKEKIGSARWYRRFSSTMDQDTKDRLSDLVNAAMVQTFKRCIACGCVVEDIPPAGQPAMCQQHEKECRADSDAFWAWVEPETYSATQVQNDS